MWQVLGEHRGEGKEDPRWWDGGGGGSGFKSASEKKMILEREIEDCEQKGVREADIHHQGRE